LISSVTTAPPAPSRCRSRASCHIGVARFPADHPQYRFPSGSPRPAGKLVPVRVARGCFARPVRFHPEGRLRSQALAHHTGMGMSQLGFRRRFSKHTSTPANRPHAPTVPPRAVRPLADAPAVPPRFTTPPSATDRGGPPGVLSKGRHPPSARPTRLALLRAPDKKKRTHPAGPIPHHPARVSRGFCFRGKGGVGRRGGGLFPLMLTHSGSAQRITKCSTSRASASRTSITTARGGATLSDPFGPSRPVRPVARLTQGPPSPDLTGRWIPRPTSSPPPAARKPPKKRRSLRLHLDFANPLWPAPGCPARKARPKKHVLHRKLGAEQRHQTPVAVVLHGSRP